MNDSTFSFIKSLTDFEIKAVKEYFKMSISLSSSEIVSTKQMDLFNLLIEDKENKLTEEDILKKLGTKNLSSLKNELVSKIADALTQNRFYENNKELDENIFNIYLLKKKVLFLRIIARANNKNRAEFVFQLFFDIINTAKKFEAYDVLIEVLRFQKYYKGIRRGDEDFNKTQESIDFYSYCDDAFWRAIDCYYKVIINNELKKTMSSAQVFDFIKKSIQEIEKDYKKTQSHQIFYYLQILKFAYNEEIGNIKESIKQCVKLIDFLKDDEVVFSRARMGFANDNLSRYYAYEGDYKKAIKTAIIAQQNYDENTFSYLISKESEFYIHLYNGDHTSANSILNYISNHELADSGKFRKSKFIFYKACTYFAQKKFKEALEQIRTNLEIEKDKSGWNIYLRLINTMTLIELGKADEAIASLESMRKYKERMKKDEEAGITERHWIICDVLKEWEKSGFAFHTNDKNMLAFAQKLSEKGQAYSWKMFGNELIPFHTWFEEKIKK
jgi:tetratricopeptide (TPR) repeat protein